ncbi:MAG: hypothetical protein FWF49_06580 [Oscillospiraceae bacterium]|nr:hypothetical protein [Oscillospiraceae bacterium]
MIRWQASLSGRLAEIGILQKSRIGTAVLVLIAAVILIVVLAVVLFLIAAVVLAVVLVLVAAVLGLIVAAVAVLIAVHSWFPSLKQFSQRTSLPCYYVAKKAVYAMEIIPVMPTGKGEKLQNRDDGSTWVDTKAAFFAI